MLLKTTQNFNLDKKNIRNRYEQIRRRSNLGLQRQNVQKQQMMLLASKYKSEITQLPANNIDTVPKIERKYSKNAALKNIIDGYFKEDNFLDSQMSLVNKDRKRRMSHKHEIIRKYKQVKPEEQLSKSINLATSHEKPSNDKIELRPSSFIRWNINQMQNLPPIHELNEDRQELQICDLSALGRTSYSKSNYGRSNSVFSDLGNPQKQMIEERIPTFENEIFVIYVVLQNKKAKLRLKEYKQSGIQIMKRQLRMQIYQMPSIWRESKYNSLCFATSMSLPLKDLIMKITVDQNCADQYKIKPRQLHKNLLANNSQQLVLLIKNFCLDLKKVEGKVLNNKINISNLFFVRNERICLGEWGYSSIRQSFNIQMNSFQSRKHPILRGEKDWFVSPQYLAPQLLQSMIHQQNSEYWTEKSKSDIWSLGLAIFQILTLIPLWMGSKCQVIGKPQTLRPGFLSTENRNLQKILDKQYKFSRIAKRHLYSELETNQLNENLIQITLRMIEPDLSKRITLDEIISLI